MSRSEDGSDCFGRALRLTGILIVFTIALTGFHSNSGTSAKTLLKKSEFDKRNTWWSKKDVKEEPENPILPTSFSSEEEKDRYLVELLKKIAAEQHPLHPGFDSFKEQHKFEECYFKCHKQLTVCRVGPNWNSSACKRKDLRCYLGCS